MSPRATLATMMRVLTQLRRDPRTIALIIVVPALLITLLRYLFDGQPQVFDRIGGTMLGIFPFITMFVVTSVTMLRERVTGTLERLMTMPIAKLDILAGYAVAFALVAVVQSTIVSLIAFQILHLHVGGLARRGRCARSVECDARDGAWAVRERICADGVPGGAVHAGDRFPAGAAVWVVRRA